jgi:hypothetical protein
LLKSGLIFHLFSNIGHNKKQLARGGKRMKNKLLLVFVIVSVLLFTGKIGVQAIASTGKIETISKGQEDLTGDGKKDTIVLTGAKTGVGTYKNLVIKIKIASNPQIKIDLPQGYKPSYLFIDLNQDGIKDLFTSVYPGKRSPNPIQTVYIAKDAKLTNLALPEPLMLEGHFLNGYKAKVTIKKTGNNYIFDLKKRKKFYEKLGIFYNGKLNEPTELMINQFRELKPLQTGEKIGLKGTQKITGVSNSDTIGYVESTWLYDQTGWKLTNVTVVQDN